MFRVVIVQEYIPQYRVSFFDLLRAKALKEGIEVIVAFGDPGPSLGVRGDASILAGGQKIRQCEFRFARRRVVLRSTRAVMRNSDVVVLEQARRNIDAYRMLASPWRGRRKVALWGHGRDYTRPATGIDFMLQRWLTSRADWFFAYTSGGAAALLRDGFERSRITVVQNSIDTSSLKLAVEGIQDVEIDEFASKYDLRGCTGLFIGALDKSKRLPFLIESARLAHSMCSDFRLLIAGAGADADFISATAAELPFVHYLGPLLGHEKALAMRGSQLLAMPGRVGLVAVDSFAAGTPIVTTDWPWHAPEFEYLEADLTAVITTDDPESYAQGLVDTLTNVPKLRALSQSCTTASREFTVSAMAENFLSGIRHLIGERP